MFYINTVLCPIKVNSNTIEVTMHTSCYCVLDLLCVKMPPCKGANIQKQKQRRKQKNKQKNYVKTELGIFLFEVE